MRGMVWSVNRELERLQSGEARASQHLLQNGGRSAEGDIVWCDSTEVWLRYLWQAVLSGDEGLQRRKCILLLHANYNRPQRSRVLCIVLDVISGLNRSKTGTESNQDGFEGSRDQLGKSLGGTDSCSGEGTGAQADGIAVGCQRVWSRILTIEPADIS
jgi:hypothetical protein